MFLKNISFFNNYLCLNHTKYKCTPVKNKNASIQIIQLELCLFYRVKLNKVPQFAYKKQLFGSPWCCLYSRFTLQNNNINESH